MYELPNLGNKKTVPDNYMQRFKQTPTWWALNSLGTLWQVMRKAKAERKM